MTPNLTRTLTAAYRHAPQALVNAEARAALDGITDRIPAALTRRLYLECRLGAADSRVDVVFCVDRSSRDLLARARDEWAAERVALHPVWTALDRLCSEWADPASPIAPVIYDLWLEFDTDRAVPAARTLVPSVFVGLARAASRPDAIRAALACAATIADRPVAGTVADAVDAAIGCLPSGAYAPYMGVMCPRTTTAVRLCVAPLAGERLVEYLAAIGWCGDIDGLVSALNRLPAGPTGRAFDATTLLHIELEDGVQPRVGVEIPLGQARQCMDGIAEVALFDALCAAGLCTDAKRHAVLSWPGHGIESFPHQRGPSLALRRVSHVKLVADASGQVEAKTYLSFFHQVSQRHAREIAGQEAACR
jgi:hypothetical protein